MFLLNGHLVRSAKCLGLTITDNLEWGQHVSEIPCKANKTLGNLALAPRYTKEVANKTLVRPQLEYVSPIWHPYNDSETEKKKGTRRQRSGKGAIRKRFPLQKPRWEKTKLTIRYLYHETYRKPNEQLFSQ